MVTPIPIGLSYVLLIICSISDKMYLVCCASSLHLNTPSGYKLFCFWEGEHQQHFVVFFEDDMTIHTQSHHGLDHKCLFCAVKSKATQQQHRRYVRYFSCELERTRRTTKSISSERDSNTRPQDLQSHALPSELSEDRWLWLHHRKNEDLKLKNSMKPLFVSTQGVQWQSLLVIIIIIIIIIITIELNLANSLSSSLTLSITPSVNLSVNPFFCVPFAQDSHQSTCILPFFVGIFSS